MYDLILTPALFCSTKQVFLQVALIYHLMKLIIFTTKNNIFQDIIVELW